MWHIAMPLAGAVHSINSRHSPNLLGRHVETNPYFHSQRPGDHFGSFAMTAECEGFLIRLVKPESDSKAASTWTQEELAARAANSFSIGNTTAPISFRFFKGAGLRSVITTSNFR